MRCVWCGVRVAGTATSSPVSADNPPTDPLPPQPGRSLSELVKKAIVNASSCVLFIVGSFTGNNMLQGRGVDVLRAQLAERCVRAFVGVLAAAYMHTYIHERTRPHKDADVLLEAFPNPASAHTTCTRPHACLEHTGSPPPTRWASGTGPLQGSCCRRGWPPHLLPTLYGPSR